MPDQESNADLNVLSEDPLCAGVFLPNLDVPISPTEGHFIRSHFSAPQINSSDWSLPVTGEINWFREEDVNYMLDVHVIPREVIERGKQGFAGQP